MTLLYSVMVHMRCRQLCLSSVNENKSPPHTRQALQLKLQLHVCKMAKYSNLTSQHTFCLLTVESLGPLN